MALELNMQDEVLGQRGDTWASILLTRLNQRHQEKMISWEEDAQTRKSHARNKFHVFRTSYAWS